MKKPKPSWTKQKPAETTQDRRPAETTNTPAPAPPRLPRDRYQEAKQKVEDDYLKRLRKKGITNG